MGSNQRKFFVRRIRVRPGPNRPSRTYDPVERNLADRIDMAAVNGYSHTPDGFDLRLQGNLGKNENRTLNCDRRIARSANNQDAGNNLPRPNEIHNFTPPFANRL